MALRVAAAMVNIYDGTGRFMVHAGTGRFMAHALPALRHHAATPAAQASMQPYMPSSARVPARAVSRDGTWYARGRSQRVGRGRTPVGADSSQVIVRCDTRLGQGAAAGPLPPGMSGNDFIDK